MEHRGNFLHNHLLIPDRVRVVLNDTSPEGVRAQCGHDKRITVERDGGLLLGKVGSLVN